MAYALVKAGTPVASGSPLFGQATGQGNLLIAWIIPNGGGTISTTAPGWLQAVADSATFPVTAIWYKPNSAASETAPVFVVGGAGVPFESCLAEFSGGATSSPVDRTGNGGAGSATTPLTVNTAGADAASGELVVATQADSLSKSGTTTTTHTYNNGGSAQAIGNNDATSTNTHYRFSWATTTGNSAADQVQFADTSMNLSLIQGCIASFKLVSAARFPRNPAIDFIDPAFV